jgi:hypothetical protein
MYGRHGHLTTRDIYFLVGSLDSFVLSTEVHNRNDP